MESYQLPTEVQPWPVEPNQVRDLYNYLDEEDAPLDSLREYGADKSCLWPDRTIYFFCDMHADTEAFLLSLEASGGVKRTGEGDGDFVLTEAGKGALFIIGGDCFDKGPDNLRLLRCLHGLIKKGASVSILAGNHDLRTYLGLAYAGRRETRFQHLFVRMGKKTVPLFKEIHDELARTGNPRASSPEESQVRSELFPDEQWYERFPEDVRDVMTPKKIDKEVRRIREKSEELQGMCARLGMSLSDLHVALREAQHRFLDPEGEFAWYFERMTLAHRAGSFLFVHAGLDDTLAQVLLAEGVDGLNTRYATLVEQDLFKLYNGCVGNAFRTKYRDIDYPLTSEGLQALRRAGIYAVVHGHRNILRGQRITLRAGILNFECDASVDRNTRRLEGLEGPGGAVLAFSPSGHLSATSTDYPFIKRFYPERVFGLTTLTQPPPSPSEDQS